MERTTERRPIVLKTFFVLLIIFIALAAFSFILYKGSKNDLQLQVPNSTPTNETTIPGGQVNPNGTGGASGAGTGLSNDPSVQNPSPAGGIDTNNSLRGN